MVKQDNPKARITHEAYGIIDIHAHVFPPRMAARAVASISDFYDIPMAAESGTADELLAISQACGIAFTVVFSTATRVEQVESINRFMTQCQQHPALIAFGSLHPDQTTREIGETLEVIMGNDLRGIKMHPDFQQVHADSPFMQELCHQLHGRLPLMLHAGDPRYDYSHPYRISRLAEKFPETTIIAAHFGGWSRWPEAIESLSGLPNVLVDTSSSLPLMSPAEACALIEAFGIERVLFGSDYPMWRPDQEIALVKALNLTAAENKAIFWTNSARLLGLEG